MKCELCKSDASGGRAVKDGDYSTANYLCLWCIEDIKADNWTQIARRAKNPISIDEGDGMTLDDLVGSEL